jgi:hypothetical protein
LNWRRKNKIEDQADQILAQLRLPDHLTVDALLSAVQTHVGSRVELKKSDRYNQGAISGELRRDEEEGVWHVCVPALADSRIIETVIGHEIGHLLTLPVDPKPLTNPDAYALVEKISGLNSSRFAAYAYHCGGFEDPTEALVETIGSRLALRLLQDKNQSSDAAYEFGRVFGSRR